MTGISSGCHPEQSHVKHGVAKDLHAADEILLSPSAPSG
jgi:hypothetical protein